MPIVDLVISGVPARLITEDRGFNVIDDVDGVRVDLTVNFTEESIKKNYGSVSGSITFGGQKHQASGVYTPAFTSTLTLRGDFPREIMLVVKEAINKAFRAQTQVPRA